MQIIKNREIVDNPWRLEDDASGDGGADGGRIIVPLQRWHALRASRAAGERRIGVKLRPEEAVEPIAADLRQIPIIALEFDTFHEGRGYSQAVQLRRQHHYKGEIRALGAHRDNLPLMERCGIDSYDLAGGEDLAQALAAFGEITAY